MSLLWTWGGRCFGYREGENLWTSDGRHVGKFWGEEIYGCDGQYLGQLWLDNRLIASQGKNTWRRSPFPPLNHRRRSPLNCSDRIPYAFRHGYEEFPGL